MPALTKDNKLIKRVQTPARIHSRSLNNTEVKRLVPSRRISSKRTQTQSIQTQTVLASLIQNDKYKRTDEGTQTNDDIDNYDQNPTNGFTSRLVRFFGGTIVSFMKLFNGK